jgi:cysteamine dioxygenase
MMLRSEFVKKLSTTVSSIQRLGLDVTRPRLPASQKSALQQLMEEHLRPMYASLKWTDISDRLPPVGTILERSGKRDILYFSVVRTPEMEIGAFLMPKGSTMPLHDHPGLSVLGRLLDGAIHMVGFEDDGTCTFNEKLIQGGPGIYLPSSSLHAIRALENTAFFDIIAPAYDWDNGRPCMYYKVHGHDIWNAVKGTRLPLEVDQHPEITLRALQASDIKREDGC